MTIAYLDCFSGISGDMAVGAFLDLGVPLEVVRDAIACLDLGPNPPRLATRGIERSMIRATKFDVLDAAGEAIDRMPEQSEGDHHHHAHDHDHAHTHTHTHDHAHPHDHTHEHAHAHTQGHGHTHDHGHHHSHTSFASIREMIERSTLADGVKRRSVAIFDAIAVGEARVHGVAKEDVHFHEVGAIDSIVDIVAVAVCLEHLGVERLHASTIPLGSGGMIRTQHGVMPLPAPATLEILKGHPVSLTNVPFELTTPTGAGIVAALSSGPLEPDHFRPVAVGFGAGTRELPDRPNLLRVVIAEIDEVRDEPTREMERDSVVVIETSIDDMSPQLYEHLFDRLLAAGALDVHLTQVMMKKGRPGCVVTLLSAEADGDRLVEILFAETSTIGVRFSRAERRKLPRRQRTVETPFGPVRMKEVGSGALRRIVPEYEEGRRIAREHALPLLDVMRHLQTAAAQATAGGEVDDVD